MLSDYELYLLFGGIPLQPTHRTKVDVAHPCDLELLFDLLQRPSRLSVQANGLAMKQG
jgi:hypothetical protein